MPKKKKRRPPQRPRPRPQPAGDAEAAREAVESAGSDQTPSRRAERKEEARRERERRMRQARRRQRNRRLIRWGIVLGIAAGIAAIVWFAGSADRERSERAVGAAERIDASPVEEQDATQPNRHEEPYAQGEGGVPAFGGNHTPGTLEPEPKVYPQQPPEETALHNLEHGYVIVYYSGEGDTALDPEIVGALEDLVNEETEVLMSPYTGLAEPLYLVAWGARQAIDPPADASVDDVVLVVEDFIEEWKNGSHAPEAAAG